MIHAIEILGTVLGVITLLACAMVWILLKSPPGGPGGGPD